MPCSTYPPLHTDRWSNYLLITGENSLDIVLGFSYITIGSHLCVGGAAWQHFGQPGKLPVFGQGFFPGAVVELWSLWSLAQWKREVLTQQFHSLGESPSLVSLTPSVELDVSSQGFDSSER